MLNNKSVGVIYYRPSRNESQITIFLFDLKITEEENLYQKTNFSHWKARQLFCRAASAISASLIFSFKNSMVSSQGPFVNSLRSLMLSDFELTFNEQPTYPCRQDNDVL